MANPTVWYRLVLDERGKVDSCECVDAAGESSLRVVYVMARTPKEAARKAYNRHCALRLRATRKRLDAEGKCRCGRERDRAGFKRCSWCKDRSRVYHERLEAKARGEAVAPLSVRETRDRRRAEESAGFEVSLLVEVEAAADTCRTMGAFRSWLRNRIRCAEDKGIAAE